MAVIDRAPSSSFSSYVYQKPKNTLDRFTAIAMICLKPFFEKENDRLAIHNHKIILQPSYPVEAPLWGPVTLPGIGQLDWQSACRFIGGNSREELADMIIAIEEGLYAYIEYKPFQAMLVPLEEGLQSLGQFYKTIDSADNTATTVLRLGITKTKDAMEHKLDPAKYRKKHPIDGISDELQTIRSKVISSWSLDEMSVIASMLMLATKKRNEKQDYLPEVQALLTYLDAKQTQNIQNLTEEQKLLDKSC